MQTGIVFVDLLESRGWDVLNRIGPYSHSLVTIEEIGELVFSFNGVLVQKARQLPPIHQVSLEEPITKEDYEKQDSQIAAIFGRRIMALYSGNEQKAIRATLVSITALLQTGDKQAFVTQMSRRMLKWLYVHYSLKSEHLFADAVDQRDRNMSAGPNQVAKAIKHFQ